ncbi:MAG: serine/threonine-protein kinase [Pseudomonadota bacterium]
MKEKIWSKDWFAALSFAFVFAVIAGFIYSDNFQSLERYNYDIGMRARERAPSEKVAVIAIDDDSIKNIGRWPWPREKQVRMLEILREGGAKVVGNTVFYFERQADANQQFVDTLVATLTGSPLTTQIPIEIETFGAMLADGAKNPAVGPIAEAYKQSALATQFKAEMEKIVAQVTSAQGAGSADKTLADAMGLGPKTVLAMDFVLGETLGNQDQALPDYIKRNALSNIQDRVGARDNGWLPIPTNVAQIPLPELGAAAAAIGHLTQTLDVDGANRYAPLVLRHYEEFYPSLALMVAAQALNLQSKDIEVRLGEGIAMGGLEIGTTPDLRMYTHYYSEVDEKPPFQIDSFYDVFSGKIPASKYKDKVVLIGATAAGVGAAYPTPVQAAMAPVVTMAHTVSSILQQDFFSRPGWAYWAEIAVFLMVTAFLALLVPKLGPSIGAMATGGFAVALFITELSLLAGSALWLQLTTPMVLLLTGFLFMTVKRLRLTEMLKVSSEAESSESNKMLGLAFQGQGQLDMAFEKFRSVKPVDDKLLDLMYNLALDFERKRQFNKTESVFQYIATQNKDFRDVQQRLSRAKKLSETVILGGGSSHPGGGTLIMNTDNADGTQKMEIEKPMLGRYQVEKELGKGAMGIVYLGKDPKIGRTVAIKTMALTQEFEADELASVKERFFREAETAGRLSHPNIVQIFDAGEEHDLAYIAMEFIKGHDLTKHIKPNTLLTVNEVLKYVSDAADALDYAHSNGVVHRDIKPANMMLVEATKTIKLMDFGIARLSDSSKTKTGMVLGTPSYMSPEQLSGKKVDGRSDLFSLGVTLYQLLTGALPFQAESMATLMFKIANEVHPQPNIVRPDLPPGIAPIIDRALAKDAERRYARGNELSRDLRALIAG